MPLTSSMEDYLEAVLIVAKKQIEVRSVDICLLYTSTPLRRRKRLPRPVSRPANRRLKLPSGLPRPRRGRPGLQLMPPA